MIEAFLLALEFLAVILLLVAVSRPEVPGEPRSLGIFAYKELRSDADLVKPKKKAQQHA